MPIVDPLLDRAVNFVRLPNRTEIETHFSDYLYLFHTETAKLLFGNFYFIVTATLRLRHDKNAVKMVYMLSVDQQLRNATKGRFGLDHPECAQRWKDLYILARVLILSAIADMSSNQIKQLYTVDLHWLQIKYTKAILEAVKSMQFT